MSPDQLLQHLQQDAPDVLQRLEPVIDQVYRDHLQAALDATRKHWYVGLTTQYLVQDLLTVYRRRVGQAAAAGTVDVGSVDATLATTVAESYEGTAWDAFVRRLARELCLAALDTLVQEAGVTGLAAMPVAVFTAAITTHVTTGTAVPLQERLTHLLTRTAEDVAFEVATNLVLRSPALADLEHLLGLPPTAPPRLHRQGVLPLLREAHLTVLSAAHYQAVREAIYKNTFQRLDGLPWPTALVATGPARGQVQLRPIVADAQPWMPLEEMDAWAQRMWRHRAELSDLDADALDALSALWLGQARTPKDDAIAHVDDLLALRGLQARRSGQGRRGGYEDAQRIAMLQALGRLQSLWLQMAEVEVYAAPPAGARRRRATQQSIQSRAFVITDLFGQLRPDGFLDVDKFVFRPGQVFGHFLFGPGRQTALLSAHALHYDPLRQTWEKRLTRYLSYQWRCRAHNGDYLQPYRVATLLAAIGATVDRRHPGRTRARLERALDLLLADLVIAAWQYDHWDEGHATRQGWVDHWLQATMLIEPPEVIQQQYQRLAQHEAATRAALPAPDSLGERLKRRRRQRGLTLMQAAEQLGISPSYLSRLEQGRRGHSLPVAVQRRLDTWLAAPPEAAEAPEEPASSLATPPANQVAIFEAAAHAAPVGP